MVKTVIPLDASDAETTLFEIFSQQVSEIIKVTLVFSL